MPQPSRRKPAVSIQDWLAEEFAHSRKGPRLVVNARGTARGPSSRTEVEDPTAACVDATVRHRTSNNAVLRRRESKFKNLSGGASNLWVSENDAVLGRLRARGCGSLVSPANRTCEPILASLCMPVPTVAPSTNVCRLAVHMPNVR